jgi:hypothetical protein
MITKAFVLEGDHLALNYSTSAAGGIRIEVQTAAGEPIPGYTLEECPLMIGDTIDRTVAWAAHSDLRALNGQAVRLRFVMKDADLFALSIRAAQ